MKQNSRTIRYSGTYSNPGTPEYDNSNGGEMPKCWSSERATNPIVRRHVPLMPFNSGRALPSKWDDAERWITSPVSTYGSAAANTWHPKSKSGPLGLVYLSPQPGNFMPNSPLTAGVLLPDSFSIRYDGGGVAKPASLCDQHNMITSGSVSALPDLLSETSSQGTDDKPDGTKEKALVSDGVNQRIMATQMSPDGSTCSSSKGRLSFFALPFSGPTSLHQNGNPASRDEVRDVEVDKGITTARQSKKQGVRKMKDSCHIQDTPSLPWNASEASKNTSKLQREEAKITAWENLQKAKAEAAIRKLEMRLEKKRSASMDRIMNKLRASEMKAQAMRNLLSQTHAPEVHSSSHRGFSVSKYVKVHLRGNCFDCRRN